MLRIGYSCSSCVDQISPLLKQKVMHDSLDSLLS
jgi:hypothetical protein